MELCDSGPVNDSPLTALQDGASHGAAVHASESLRKIHRGKTRSDREPDRVHRKRRETARSDLTFNNVATSSSRYKCKYKSL